MGPQMENQTTQSRQWSVFIKKHKPNLPNLRLLNEDMAYVKNYRYLGEELHHRLNGGYTVLVSETECKENCDL